MTRKQAPSAQRPGIQVIARAAAVLRVLEDQPEGLTLAQIAERVDLARSTVQRIVGALAAEQLLIAASPVSGVKLGPALIRLASAANVDVERLVRPTLSELSQTLKETVDLSVLKGTTAVFIDQIPGAHRLRAVSAIGESFPLHCTANGKALLALLPDGEWTRHLPRTLTKLTSATMTDVATLEHDLRKCRETHVAVDHEEHTEGISAVGCAFFDPFGRALALSIPVPTTRFSRLEAKLVTEIKRAKREIKAILDRA